MKLVASLYSWALTLVASTVIGSIVSVIYPAIAFSASKTINLGEFKWADTLREYKIRKVNVCGNADIQVTKRSIGKDFLIGNPKTGYLFSGLITHEDYWKTLESYDLEKAKANLKNRFNMAVLWQISGAGEVTRIGTPSRVAFAMTATVKDCVNGAKTSLGLDCSNRENKLACCKEKFIGPEIYWKDNQGEFRLSYSPDPSIKLKVPNERKLRFCNSIDSIEL
ncbi:MAG: hypothetical protein FJ112_02455 [Deltaproteobacteria bacterium]|nr:hypothetical protein [Deltaproteobacteria bacterium]